jgi:hypothetical protein
MCARTGMSGTGFAEALLEEMQVAVMPGESFGAAAAGHVRVALTLPDDGSRRPSTGFCLRRRPRRGGVMAAPGIARRPPIRRWIRSAARR